MSISHWSSSMCSFLTVSSSQSFTLSEAYYTLPLTLVLSSGPWTHSLTACLTSQWEAINWNLKVNIFLVESHLSSSKFTPPSVFSLSIHSCISSYDISEHLLCVWYCVLVGICIQMNRTWILTLGFYGPRTSVNTCFIMPSSSFFVMFFQITLQQLYSFSKLFSSYIYLKENLIVLNYFPMTVHWHICKWCGRL